MDTEPSIHHSFKLKSAQWDQFAAIFWRFSDLAVGTVQFRLPMVAVEMVTNVWIYQVLPVNSSKKVISTII